MTTFNIYDRPRVLVAGCESNHALTQAVRASAGFFSIEPVGSQPLHERDVGIVWQDAADGRNRFVRLGGQQHKHLRVLQFGGASLTSTWVGGSRVKRHGPQLKYVLGDQLHLAETCPTGLRQLVKDSLIPLLAARGSKRQAIADVWEDDPHAAFTPLLKTSTGDVLAAIYSHPDIAEVWWLPVEPEDAATFDFAAWIGAAFDAWHGQDPDRFPGPADWTRSTEWMTHEELQLLQVMKGAEAELERLRAELTTRVKASVDALAEAQARHDAVERVLLTGQGEGLVRAVKAALERFGLLVEDRDETSSGQKLEDLRVSVPGSSWVAIAEVKGYLTSGGKPRDLQQLNRFFGIYQGTTGSPPDASWYIVNQQAATAPDRRRKLMSNHREDVDEFVEQVNGVLIDTRDLFRLDRHVSAGETTAEAAREMLMSSNRRFSFQPTEEHDDD